MESPSIADAVASAMPNVAELLDRHARWSAQMCRNVPSANNPSFRNVPPPGAPDVVESAGTFRNVPECSGMLPRREKDKTNPPVYRPAERPLTYRQLAGARLIVAGFGTMDIAHHLGVEHHTIARWKRNPRFTIELERLRALCTAAAVTRNAPTAAPRSPAPTPPPRPAPLRMTRQQIEQEDRECEALIEQMLRAKPAASGR